MSYLWRIRLALYRHLAVYNYFNFKDVIGVGSEWRHGKLIRYLKSNYSKYSEADMWRQLKRIGKEVLLAIVSHDTCKKYAKKMVNGRHFEVYGMDILLDEDYKCWLLESNRQRLETTNFLTAFFSNFLKIFTPKIIITNDRSILKS